VCVVATGCSSAPPRIPATAATGIGIGIGATSAYGAGPTGGTTATARAAQDATRAFADQVGAATASFVAAVGRLQTDTSAGDTAAARADELDAQAAYDSFRVLEVGNAVNGATLDELATDVAPAESFGGLHAVERDLWSAGPLGADVAGVAGQALVAQFLLGRERLGPEAVATVAVDQLGWAVDTALPESQEQYSHLGLVDVVATVRAARQSLSDVEPLARMVDPTLVTSVDGQFAVLDARVAALGDPTSVPDTAVDLGARLALSHELDATASTLARLAATLTPFGTRGAPS
jgi:iron uptake system component EfeO